MNTIYLASGNAHKLHELQTALEQAGLPISVKGPDEIGGMPEVEETEPTFEGNSLLKAEGLREAGPSEGWFLADDSGIEIDALDGRPGVISARYAGWIAMMRPITKGAQGNEKVPQARRSCRFRCVLALVGEGVDETFPALARELCFSRGEEREALGTIRCSFPMRANLLSPR